MGQVIVLTNKEQTTGKIFVVDEDRTPIVEVPEMPLEQAKILANWVHTGVSHDIYFHNTSLEYQLNLESK